MGSVNKQGLQDGTREFIFIYFFCNFNGVKEFVKCGMRVYHLYHRA